MNKEHICIICNNKFNTNTPNKQVCSVNCGKIHYNNKAKKYQKLRRQEPFYKLKDNTTHLVYSSLRNNKQQWKKRKLPFTYEELYKHLKNELPKGYLWNDYLKAELQLEHKIPISWFKDKDLFFSIGWNLANLTLLTKEENWIKNNKYAVVGNEIFLSYQDAEQEFIKLYGGLKHE